jgi:hypothetical protein
MIGAAISSVLIHFLLIILQMQKISKSTRIKIKNLLPYKKLGILFIISGIIGIILKQLSFILDLGNVINFFVYGVIIFVLTILVYLKLNLIPKQFIISILDKSKLKRRNKIG